jgi:hypothetical protein
LKKPISKVVKFLGLSLGGGKQDKACLSVMEYYPDQKRIFLSKIVEKIKNDESTSADSKIHELLQLDNANVDFLAIDVPAQLPLCLECQLKCPGYENCTEPHIEWMWQHYESLNVKKRPRRFFTPYTQRCVEMHLATELEESFLLPHLLGSNSAPLVARARFILRRSQRPVIEVNPKLSVWRIGRSLGIRPSQLRFHRHSVGGDESRRLILNTLGEHNIAFLYEQDRKLMIENNHAFESFICAMTGFLKAKGYTEKKPSHFPEKESWIEFPQIKIPWAKLFVKNP